MSKIIFLLGVILLFGPRVGFAATDGTLGTSSTGEIGVSVSLTPKPTQIQITGLDDVNFDKNIGDSLEADQTITACVYMNDPGTYGVEVEATALTNGSQNYPYSLSLTQSLAGSKRIDLSVTNTTVEASETGFQPDNVLGCNGGDRLLMTFKDVGNSAITDTFSATATVTIIVMPD